MPGTVAGAPAGTPRGVLAAGTPLGAPAAGTPAGAPAAEGPAGVLPVGWSPYLCTALSSLSPHKHHLIAPNMVGRGEYGGKHCHKHPKKNTQIMMEEENLCLFIFFFFKKRKKLLKSFGLHKPGRT